MISEKLNKTTRYLENLNEEALFQLCKQLILYPESLSMIEKAIDEWDEFYSYPLKQ